MSTESIKYQMEKDPQSIALKEISAQRDLLEMQLDILNAQITMQKLFVDTHTAVLAYGTNRLFDATIKGKPVKLEIVDYYANNTYDYVSLGNEHGARIFAYDGETDAILCDLALSKPKNKKSWEAEVARYPVGWTRKNGNPGISWEKASNKFGNQALDGAVNGLLPELIDVASAMNKVAEQIFLAS